MKAILWTILGTLLAIAAAMIIFRIAIFTAIVASILMLAVCIYALVRIIQWGNK